MLTLNFAVCECPATWRTMHTHVRRFPFTSESHEYERPCFVRIGRVVRAISSSSAYVYAYCPPDFVVIDALLVLRIGGHSAWNAASAALKSIAADRISMRSFSATSRSIVSTGTLLSIAARRICPISLVACSPWIIGTLDVVASSLSLVMVCPVSGSCNWSMLCRISRPGLVRSGADGSRALDKAERGSCEKARAVRFRVPLDAPTDVASRAAARSRHAASEKEPAAPSGDGSEARPGRP